MSQKAAIREADLRRLAKVAKAENVAFRVAVNGMELTILPNAPGIGDSPPAEKKREVVF